MKQVGEMVFVTADNFGSEAVITGLRESNEQPPLHYRVKTPRDEFWAFDFEISEITNMKRFRVRRNIDATGKSGTGIVAEGVQFSDGRVAWHWSADTNALQVTSTIVYDSIQDAETVHGHGGLTVIEWIDL